MKSQHYSYLFILALIVFSCKKEDKPNGVVEFNSTTYQSMGTFDDNGKPSYLLTRDVVSSDMLTFITTTLPEKQDLRITNPDLLTTKAIADVAITKQSDVFITFITQAGILSNTFAYYTYPTNQPPASTKDIKLITYIFPNSGAQTALQQGDKVKLGQFPAGTSIGFVVLQKGWDYVTKSINSKAVHFCSNDVLNPEINTSLKKHAVLINYVPENKILIAFEDQDRSLDICDHDFNDVVFYCTVTPQ